LVREIGSGVPPVVEKGERREEVVVPARAVVVGYVEATPLDALGSRGITKIPRIFGIPFVTRKENVPPDATPVKEYWNKSLYTIFLVGVRDKYLCSAIGDIV
jgi:hypothetical protein